MTWRRPVSPSTRTCESTSRAASKVSVAAAHHSRACRIRQLGTPKPRPFQLAFTQRSVRTLHDKTLLPNRLVPGTFETTQNRLVGATG